MSIYERYRHAHGGTGSALEKAEQSRQALLEHADEQAQAKRERELGDLVRTGEILHGWANDFGWRKVARPEDVSRLGDLINRNTERIFELQGLPADQVPPYQMPDVVGQRFAQRIAEAQEAAATLPHLLPGPRAKWLSDRVADIVGEVGRDNVARLLMVTRRARDLTGPPGSVAEQRAAPREGEPSAEAAASPVGVPGEAPDALGPGMTLEERVGALIEYAMPAETGTQGRLAAAAPEQVHQTGGPARSVAPHQPPEPMTATEPAAPAVPPAASGPSISVPPRPRSISGRRGQSRGPYLPDAETLAIFQEACKQYNVPLDLALAVGYQESRLNPETPPSGAGAIGIMQLMPKTAAGLGVDPNDKRQNIFGGVRLLASHLARYGSVDYALVAYNAGPGRVKRAKEDWNKLPRETRNYVPSVKHWREQYAVMLAPKPRPGTGGPDGT